MIPQLKIDPFDEAFLADPYTHHAELRDAGALVWLEPISCYAMARFDHVQLALKDWQTYISGRGVGLADFAHQVPSRPPSLLLETDPPVHERTRGLMKKIVSLSALGALRPAWREQAEILVQSLVTRRRFDAITELAEIYPLRIFPETVGLMDEGRENLMAYAAAVFDAFGPHNATAARSAHRAVAAVEWVAEACRRKNLKPGGWGMSVFEASDRGECTEQEAERLVRSFLSAGVDTTVNGIGNMLYAFSCFPAQWTQLRERQSLVPKAFEESLRWDSTVQTFFRTTCRDVEVEGEVIPNGSKVVLFLAAANRDPRRWPIPETFNIDRPQAYHVGFGFGIHQCLGQMVARMEGQLILESFLPRVGSIRLTGAPARRLNNALHALANLPIEVEPL